MSSNNFERKYLEDFKTFIECEEASVPVGLSEKILSSIGQDLNPSPWIVFGKLLPLQILTGLVSLTICNQFGLNPFRTNFSLSDYFMKFGHSTCMFLCGFLFIGVGVCVGRLILRIEEFQVLQKHFALQIFCLSFLSLGLFSAFGADITFIVGLLWFIGAIFGGTISAFMPLHPKHPHT